MAKPFLKLFRPSDVSSIFPVFQTEAPIPNSKKNPSAGAQNVLGLESLQFST